MSHEGIIGTEGLIPVDHFMIGSFSSRDPSW